MIDLSRRKFITTGLIATAATAVVCKYPSILAPIVKDLLKAPPTTEGAFVAATKAQMDEGLHNISVNMLKEIY